MPKDLTYFMGIDPGLKGGIAVIDASGLKQVLELEGSTLLTVSGFLTYWAGDEDCFAMIESQTGYIPGVPNPGARAFTFGTNYGALLMGLTEHFSGKDDSGDNFELVAPRTWQAGLSIRPRKAHDREVNHTITKGKRKGQRTTKKVGGESYLDFKKRLREFAQSKFSKENVTEGLADAMLLALYCRNVMINK